MKIVLHVFFNSCNMHSHASIYASIQLSTWSLIFQLQKLVLLYIPWLWISHLALTIMFKKCLHVGYDFIHIYFIILYTPFHIFFLLILYIAWIYLIFFMSSLSELMDVMTKLVFKGIQEMMWQTSHNNGGETSGDVELVSKENVAKMLQPLDVPPAAVESAEEYYYMSDADVDNDNDNEDFYNITQIPENPENQHSVAVNPLPLRRTAQMGCCGMFEVWRRSSNR